MVFISKKRKENLLWKNIKTIENLKSIQFKPHLIRSDLIS